MECSGGRQGRSAAKGAPTPRACSFPSSRDAEDCSLAQPAGAAVAQSLQILRQHSVFSRFLTSRFDKTSPP